jgi:hypothetical protein
MTGAAGSGAAGAPGFGKGANGVMLGDGDGVTGGMPGLVTAPLAPGATTLGSPIWPCARAPLPRITRNARMRRNLRMTIAVISASYGPVSIATLLKGNGVFR